MNLISVSGKNWVFKKYDENLVQKYKEKYFFDEIIARLLVIKKISEKDLSLFLNPTIKNTIPNPNILKDMNKGVEKIFSAIKNKKIIGIFGDYDVDGASATALLGNFFDHINQPYEIFIPDRIKDGYGPSVKSFDKFINKNIKIIITVDCGTISFEAIDHANNNKTSVIVLDHHQSEIKLPNAHAIINPNRLDCNSNLNYLCAAGVTFLFLISLNTILKKNHWYEENKISEPNLMNYLDLVCLGTICDVVPLVNFNRAIVRQGLKIIKQRTNLGIKTLFDLANFQSTPNSYSIGYLIGPRINAGGRVGLSSRGSELLLTKDSLKAFKIAQELEIYNKQRQELQSKLINLVEKEALKEISNPTIVLCGNDWHEGIIGILASRIKDKYNKPTILISLDGSNGKGSARSTYGFDIGATLISALKQNIIKKGGGHKMAGGFSIDKIKIDIFKNFVNDQFKKSNASKFSSKQISIDAVISATALNIEFYEKLDQLSPYGPGNSEPKFLIENVKVVNAKKVGKSHLKVVLISKNNLSFKAIAFNCIDSEIENYLSTNYKKKINIIGRLSLNEWQGKHNIEFIIEDISVIRTN